MLTLKLISNIRAQVQKIINFKDQWGGWPQNKLERHMDVKYGGVLR